jgi:fermentation-respiration switch protein FrsA (DUF1100 family)
LFCLWVQSGFSKGTVAGALTFFPPDPPLYKFERCDENGNIIPDDKDVADDKKDNDDDKKDNDDDKKTDENSPSKEGDDEAGDGTYHPNEGESREKMKSPAQQLTDRAKDLRKRAKKRNARDARDAMNNVKYKLVLDPRLSAPRFHGGSIEAVKIKTKTGAHVAAVIYRVPEEVRNENTKTIIYSHGNATDVGAMFPLQAILAHSLECNVVSYDYSGYGESGGVPMEANTYTDIKGVLDYTVEKICDKDASKVILYGQSVGSGPCCYLGCREEELGGMILHSPFLSGMRVLTPSRYVLSVCNHIFVAIAPCSSLVSFAHRALACLDIFPNIDRIRKVKCPVMLIHGRLDEEVDISHGVAMHQAVPNHLKRDPWWVPDRGHNDITEGPGKLAEYVGRLRNFLSTLDA